MHKFSLIIPLLGTQGHFEDTLATALRDLPTDCQVIVVHDGSYDDPYDLASEVQFVVADPDAGFTDCLNIGLCYASGEFTVVVRPGIELAAGWAEAVATEFENEQVASVVPVLLERDSMKRIVAAGIDSESNGTRRLVGLGKKLSRRSTKKMRPVGPSSWLAAYRTDVIKSLAPFDENLSDDYLDLDIAMSLKALGFTCAMSGDFSAAVFDPETVAQESPAGVSAQRICLRFSELLGSGTVASVCSDLIRLPFGSWRMRHLLQRFSARQFADLDLQYSTKLEKLAVSKPWQAQPVESNEHHYLSKAA